MCGDHETASILQKRLIGPNQAVTKQFGVPGLKVAMHKFGFRSGELRAPLQNASHENADKLMKIFRASGYNSKI